VRWTAIAVGIPGVLFGVPLLTDPKDASAALLHGRAFLRVGHAALWEDPVAHPIVTGSPFRAAIVVLAVALAWYFRRRGMTARVLLAGLGALFMVRLALEPVVFGYYLCPAISFLVLHEFATRGRVRRSAVLGLAMTALFPFHPAPWLWWSAEAALAVTLAWPAFGECFGRLSFSKRRVRGRAIRP
jgi:hypothetical protein